MEEKYCISTVASAINIYIIYHLFLQATIGPHNIIMKMKHGNHHRMAIESSNLHNLYILQYVATGQWYIT